MIGDWVYNTFNQQAEQVVEIRQDQVILAYNDSNDYDEIEPIPITPEILEKNGFSRKGHDHYHLEFGDYGALASYPRFGGYTGIFFQYKDTSLRSEIRYVHELQHALRICGIEKEIIMSKYIDADKLIAEIEKRKYQVFPRNDGKVRVCATPNQIQSGWLNALKWVCDTIISLQQDQPEVDLEKELDSFFPESYFETAINFDDVVNIARHFYELGLNARKEK